MSDPYVHAFSVSCAGPGSDFREYGSLSAAKCYKVMGSEPEKTDGGRRLIAERALGSTEKERTRGASVAPEPRLEKFRAYQHACSLHC